ncbi:MAG: radical SAM protein [Candidatus Hydrogenedentota bacterium]
MTATPTQSFWSRIWRPVRNVLSFGDVWIARHRDREPRTLPILVIMLTDKCNLHCKMCGACDYSPGDHNMLRLEEWLEVIDAAGRLKTQILSITGGEVLLRHNDLFPIVERARQYGIKVHLNTNALLLNRKNIERIKATGIETVSISIESHEAATHDLIRGKGMYQLALEGMRRLREAAPEVRIGLNCVINKHNLDGLHGLVPFAASEKLDQVKFAPIHTNLQHKDKDVSEYEDMIFQEADLDALDAELQRIQDEVKQTGLQSTSKEFFDGITNLYKPPASNFYCYAGYAITVIDAQGNVAACFDKDGALNVRNRPLDAIWFSPEFQVHRQLVRHCDRACWDTTNAELSLRLSMTHLARNPTSLVNAIRYYVTRKHAGPGKAVKPAAPHRVGGEKG